MLRKHFFVTVTAAALFILSAVVASAQTGELRGKVQLKQADGTMVPAADAVIDVFRTDLQGKPYTTKTNKKGEFVYAGLPYVGTYIIAVSMPNAQPIYQTDVKVGRNVEYSLVLSPGDGRRLTLDEIKKAPSGAKTGSSSGSKGESAEDKAKREEMEKINAKNERNTSINDIVGRTFKAGNAALAAKNYDEAIKQYQEGLAADPEQAALYTQIAIAARNRGVDRYNTAIQSSDQATKTTGLEAARKDFRDSAENATKAVELTKKEAIATDAMAQASQASRKLAGLVTRAESMRLFVSKVDASQADAGLTAFREYMDAETDPARKAKAQMDAAQMLMDAGAGEKAYAEFQKVLAATPDNAEANLGAGLALYSTGDKTKYQEAANYLQRFVELAPDTNRLKADAKAVLAELKNTDNVVPEKTTPARRRRP